MNAFPRLDQGGYVWLSVKERDAVRAVDFLINVHVRRQHEELPWMDNLVHFRLRCSDVRSRVVKVVFGIREGCPHIEPCSPKFRLQNDALSHRAMQMHVSSSAFSISS